MKFIKKKTEPKSLLKFRQSTPSATYNSLHGDVKDKVRNSLADEQGFICAYCMSRIQPIPECMEIEHYVSQKSHAQSGYSPSQHKSLQLQYSNMLGTCDGSRSCSAIRGNTPLTINPLNILCESQINFLSDGSVEANDTKIKSDITVLGLDNLKEQRKEAIDKARADLNKVAKTQGAWPKSAILREIKKWKSRKQTRYGVAFDPFCVAAIQYLSKKL